MNRIFGPKISDMDFLEKSVSTNRMILRVGAVFGILSETFNISRIFLTTQTKLGSLNNRIYFGFYLTYFLVCCTFLIVDFLIVRTVKARNRCYLLTGCFFLCWHVSFNIYDIYRAGAVGYFTVITVIFFMSGLLMFKPAFTLSCLGICYTSFVTVLVLMFSSGEVINFTTTVLLCILMYFVRYKHLCIEATQANRIQDIQNELEGVRSEFRLNIEQHELIYDKEGSITFEWDIQKDWIQFSKESKRYFNLTGSISNFSSFLMGLERISDEHKQILIECMENIKKGVIYQKQEIMIPDKNGEIKWFELRVITQTDDQGKPFFGIGTLSDVTEQKERINQLENKIQMDMFTGLLNKTAIEHYGERKMAELQNGEKMISMIIDMDDFKTINDEYGHPVGDYVLKEVASILRQNTPLGTRIGRIGGDEFIALFVSREPVDFETYADKLVQKVQQIRWNDTEISVSCSVGIAISSTKETYESLYKRSDDALYVAKSRGRSQINIQLSEHM